MKRSRVNCSHFALAALLLAGCSKTVQEEREDLRRAEQEAKENKELSPEEGQARIAEERKELQQTTVRVREELKETKEEVKEAQEDLEEEQDEAREAAKELREKEERVEELREDLSGGADQPAAERD